MNKCSFEGHFMLEKETELDLAKCMPADAFACLELNL